MNNFLLFVLMVFLGCSPKLDPRTVNINELQGKWGMYNDKHPDGWGNWDPPYLYYNFLKDSTYHCTFIQKKSKVLIFGTYQTLGDSLIVLFNSNGIINSDIGKVRSDTLKLYSLENNTLELHQHWYAMFTKRKKPWKHRMKFRQLTESEKDLLNETNAELHSRYLNLYKKDQNAR